MPELNIRTPSALRTDFANLSLLFAIQQHMMTEIIPRLSESDLKDLSGEEIIDIPILDPATITNLEILEEDDPGFSSLNSSMSELGYDLWLEFELDRNPLYDPEKFTCNEAKYLLSINAYTVEKSADDDYPHHETYILPDITEFADKRTVESSNWQLPRSEYN